MIDLNWNPFGAIRSSLQYCIKANVDGENIDDYIICQWGRKNILFYKYRVFALSGKKTVIIGCDLRNQII
jgi:hypothetical protein